MMASKSSPSMTDLDLTAEQRAWVPGAEEAHLLWPMSLKSPEVWDGVFHYSYWAEDGSRYDWRSVALAARTYPGWRVSLLNNGFILTIAPPE